MRLKFPIVGLLLLTVPALATAASLRTPTQVGEPSAHANEHEEGPLGQAMEGLQGGMRRLRGLAKAADDKPAILALLAELQGHTMEALALEPPVLEGQEAPAGDARILWKAGYRRQIVKLLDKLLEMEMAVAKGEMDSLQDGYSVLSSIRDEGHYEYQ